MRSRFDNVVSVRQSSKVVVIVKLIETLFFTQHAYHVEKAAR